MDTEMEVDEPVPEKVFRVSAKKPTPKEKAEGIEEVSHVFVITEKMLKMSETLAGAVDVCHGAADTEIPMEHVDKISMTHLIKFMEHHENTDPDSGEELTDWDRAFFKGIKSEELNELLRCANYLHVSLIIDDLFPDYVVEHTLGKNADQLVKLFCLKKDNENNATGPSTSQ